MKKLILGSTALLLCLALAAPALAAKQPHKEYAGMKLGECSDCHKGEGIAPNHGADWSAVHRQLASRAGSNCAQCHTQSFCLDCHKGGGIDASLKTGTFQRNYIPSSHRSDFISQHSFKSKDNPQSCVRCHDQKFCTSCHDRFPKGFRIKSHLPSGAGQTFVWNGEHAAEARRSLQSCQTCHPDGDVCLKCHSAKSGAKISPHPKNFQGDRIKDRSARACNKCHYLR